MNRNKIATTASTILLLSQLVSAPVFAAELTVPEQGNTVVTLEDRVNNESLLVRYLRNTDGGVNEVGVLDNMGDFTYVVGVDKNIISTLDTPGYREQMTAVSKQATDREGVYLYTLNVPVLSDKGFEVSFQPIGGSFAKIISDSSAKGNLRLNDSKATLDDSDWDKGVSRYKMDKYDSGISTVTVESDTELGFIYKRTGTFVNKENLEYDHIIPTLLDVSLLTTKAAPTSEKAAEKAIETAEVEVVDVDAQPELLKANKIALKEIEEAGTSIYVDEAGNELREAHNTLTAGIEAIPGYTLTKSVTESKQTVYTYAPVTENKPEEVVDAKAEEKPEVKTEVTEEKVEETKKVEETEQGAKTTTETKTETVEQKPAETATPASTPEKLAETPAKVETPVETKAQQQAAVSNQQVTETVQQQARTGKHITRFINRDNKEIAPAVEISGKVGDSYTAKPADVKGYIVDQSATRGQVNGTLAEGVVAETIFMYDVRSADVIVKHVDFNGNFINGVTKETRLSGKIGADYATEPLKVQGYELARVEGAQKGKFSDKESTVTFVYAKVGNVDANGQQITKLPDTAEAATLSLNALGTIFGLAGLGLRKKRRDN